MAGAPERRVHAGARAEAEVIFRRVGITFAVYGAKDGTARAPSGSSPLT